jgi:hypothetical protein
VGKDHGVLHTPEGNFPQMVVAEHTHVTNRFAASFSSVVKKLKTKHNKLIASGYYTDGEALKDTSGDEQMQATNAETRTQKGGFSDTTQNVMKIA